MSLERLNKEFREAVKDIMYLSVKINNSFDRVRTLQWVRKLNEQNDNDLEKTRIRNEYIQFLRIILGNDRIYFCMPFKMEPPQNDLAPLPEVLANEVCEKCPNLPKTGPIRPILMHKSPDGRAFMTVKKCPEGGVFCYMAVSPHTLED